MEYTNTSCSGYIKIRGGVPLRGETAAQGSKNGVLPLLSAAVLTAGESTIENCPDLADVRVTADILRGLGCVVTRERDTVAVDSSKADACEVSPEQMRRLRSSIVFLGALLARFGRAYLTTPGGCELGSRPIDIHIRALEQLGARVYEHEGRLDCRVEKAVGREVVLPLPSVGATENIMLFATACSGETVIVNAAREPEIEELASFLRAAGWDVRGDGTAVVTVTGGRKSAKPVVHRVMPDRIAAATYLCAAAATGGDVTVTGCRPEHLAAITDALSSFGCETAIGPDSVRLAAAEPLRALDAMLRTGPYPAFPTDAQALMAPVAALARGTTVIEENVFSDRFRHLPELARLGADVRCGGKYAVFTGVGSLSGATIAASDLRGAAGLLIGGLAAKGETVLKNACYLDRGYESIESGLNALGARCERMTF